LILLRVSIESTPALCGGGGGGLSKEGKNCWGVFLGSLYGFNALIFLIFPLLFVGVNRVGLGKKTPPPLGGGGGGAVQRKGQMMSHDLVDPFMV